MVVLQAIVTLFTRFAGKIFSALFGWAVSALFGRTTKSEQTFYSVIVAAAAAWPLLVLGCVAPRVATFIVAFVPLSKTFDERFVRAVWIVLALAVPIVLGTVFARRAPPAVPPESRVKRLLRGFPLTVGIAGAFLVVLVITPIRKISSILQGLTDDNVPLIVKRDRYREVAELIRCVLEQHGFDLKPGRPGLGKRLPAVILKKFGGAAFRGFIPDELAYYTAPGFSVMLEPNGVLLRGDVRVTPRAHGLIAEAMSHADVFQTTDPAAQEIEREIKDVWKVYDENPAAHEGSTRLRSRVADISQEIADLSVEYDDWQILYREILQLSRALHGEKQLLSKNTPKEVSMPVEREHPPAQSANPARLEELPLAELVGNITEKAKLLVQKEVELAKTELKADLKAEVGMAKGLGIAAVALIFGIQMLLVSATFVLASYMDSWLAALVVGAPFLLIGIVAAIVGWNKRVKHPLDATRASMKESVEWAKNRLA